MTETGYCYRAFISYSHADSRWAGWLQTRLERYRSPKHFSKESGRVEGSRVGRVFRDRSELPSSSNLSATLRQALQESEALVVICSPTSARSRWVNEEIRLFRALGRGDRIYPLVVEGIPGASEGQAELECFPSALTHGPDGERLDEPLAADARPGQDGKADAWLKIAASLLGVGFDELRQRELRRRNRNLAILSTLAMSVAVVTVGLALMAYQARNDATRRRIQAEDLVNFMLGDLRDKLDPVGRLDVLDAVGEKVMGYFSAIAQNDPSDSTLSAKARALGQIGRIRLLQGQLEEGILRLEEALSLSRTLFHRHPEHPDYRYNLLDSLSSVGQAELEAGRLEVARTHLTELHEMARSLTAEEPASPVWKLGLGVVLCNLGQLDFQAGDSKGALQRFVAAESILRELQDGAPDNREYVDVLFSALHWQASLLDRLSRHIEAEQAYGKVIGYCRDRIAIDPSDFPWQSNLADLLTSATSAAERIGDLDLATRRATEAAELARKLADHDPGNIEWRSRLGASRAQLADMLLKSGNAAAAEPQVIDSVRIHAANHQQEPSQIWLRVRYSEALLRDAEYALLLHQDRSRAQDNTTRSLALWQDAQTDLDARLSILRARLLAWELASDQDQIAARESAKSALAAIDDAEDQSEIGELKARFAYLDGDPEAGDALYSKLASGGYRTPLLDRFRIDACARLAASSDRLCSRSAAASS